MIRRQELYDRDCVASLIHVIEQTPLRAAVRRGLAIDRSSAGLLLLWSLLRWERTFPIETLEGLGVDLWSLTRKVDEALKCHNQKARETGAAGDRTDLDPLVRGWLDRAAEQARGLDHDFLGGEHLLLALLADGDPELAAVFQPSGLTRDALKRTIVDALAETVEVMPLDAEMDTIATNPKRQRGDDSSRGPEEREASIWIGDVDRPAIGVPRRFGVFILMLMVTMYAVLFSVLQTLRANPLVFVLLALLFTGIGIGQAVLFGGRYPRAASIGIGSILAPIEACVFAMCQKGFPSIFSDATAFLFLLAIFLFGMPLGAIFGYLFGTLTAGGFWLVDWYEKRQQATKSSSE